MIISDEHLREVFQTVVAVTVTPFGPGGELDLDAHGRLVQCLLAAGTRVITPNGNTGEFYALTCAEANAVLEATARAAAGQATLVAGIGHDVQTAIELGRCAAGAGAQAVMVHQPVHPYRSEAGWLAYHQAIAAALPEMDVIPYIRDAGVTAAMLGRLADSCANVRAVKYAVPNVLQFADTVSVVGADRLVWICGLAEMWAPFFWVAGSRGFTSGLANVAPGLSLRLLEHLQAGDWPAAMALWEQMRPFEELRARHNQTYNVSVVKEALAHLGLCGREVRPPISVLPEAERNEVARIVDHWQPLDA